MEEAYIDPSTAAGDPALLNKAGPTAGFGAYGAFVPQKRIGVVMPANRTLPVPVPKRLLAMHAVLERLAAEAGGKDRSSPGKRFGVAPSGNVVRAPVDARDAIG